MTPIARLMRSLWGPRLRPRSFPTRTPATLSTEDLIEEQTLPRYCPQHYYPVRLGETFNDRYLVVSKLGYGASSTVWLARDIHMYVLRNVGSECLLLLLTSVRWWWQANPFVTLKILTNGLIEKSAASTELEISRCIATTDPNSEGLRYLRTVLNSFEVAGPDSTHVGLVYAPMRESISRFQRRLSNGRMPGYFLKPLLAMVLTGLDHLHTRCRIIHTGTQLVGNKSSLQDEIDLALTDLKPDNILLGIENQAVIEDVVDDEAEEPTPRKMEGSRAIYPSRNFGDLQSTLGPPKIADFGLAVRGDVPQLHNHPIQADLFQAPEVILRAGWTYSVDIWNLGVMVSVPLAPPQFYVT